MFRYLKSLAIIILLYTLPAMSNSLPIKRILNSVDNELNGAVLKAMILFKTNDGVRMSNSLILKNRKLNPFLKILRISQDYKIELKLVLDSIKDNVTDSSAIDIVLIPVYRKGDKEISSWECLTNADRKVKQFNCSTTLKEYTSSYIRRVSKNIYISSCTYMNKDLVK